MQRELTKEKHVPYFGRWVRRFLQSDCARSGLGEADQIMAFEDLLARDRSLTDWQRKQGVNTPSYRLSPGPDLIRQRGDGLNANRCGFRFARQLRLVAWTQSAQGACEEALTRNNIEGLVAVPFA